MRDKLTELIESSRYWGAGTSAEIADHLIANNVLVLPEQMKDSWELCSGFITRMFVANEEELERIKKEFELQEVKKILTDIRDYLVERKSMFEGASQPLNKVVFYHYVQLLDDLTEYAEKLGVEL